MEVHAAIAGMEISLEDCSSDVTILSFCMCMMNGNGAGDVDAVVLELNYWIAVIAKARLGALRVSSSAFGMG